jgi:nucleoside-diphosphate-sugar epimerase
LQCDLADTQAVRALADAHRVDACIHAAAVSNEAYARPAPLLAVAGNVGATANLLESARTKSWRRFLLISTGSVFQLRADTRSPILRTKRPRRPMSTAPPRCAPSSSRACTARSTLQRPSCASPGCMARPSFPISRRGGRSRRSLLVRCARKQSAKVGRLRGELHLRRDVAEGLLAAASAPEPRFANYHPGRASTSRSRR